MTFLSPTVLTASYYDNYNFRSLSGFSNTALNYESSGLDAIYLTRYGDDTQASEYKHTGLLTGTAVLQLGGNSTMLYYVNYYDAKKRLIQAKSTNHIGGTEFDYFAYNFIGQPLKKRHVHSATGQATQTEVYTYNYDSAGRLLTTLHKLNTSNEVTISENTYDELGRLLTNKKGGLTATQLTYAYNVRSWTKSITGNLFSENLYYNESSGGNTPRYNGNITSISWVQDGNTRRYNYTYDDLSRLTAAGYTGIGSELYGTSYSYDKHGNILTLQRYGNTSSSTWGIINNLTMTYTGNQLTGLREGSGPVLPYTYDANGNMTSDGRKNLAITYNVLNLQQSLSQSGTTVASYNWLADGTKCGVVDNNNNGYDYTGSLIYSRSGSTRTLESIDNGVGRIYYSGGTYNPFYYLTDHLGSTRAITNSSGTVVERNDYYPFGGQHGNSSYPQLASNRFKYNGKELQTTGNTGFLDYGARMYDAVIGRWSVVDPMAEKYYSTSPYVFCDNNPATNIDPNGMDWYRYEDEDGNVFYKFAEGDAGSIEVGDNTYENVGSSVNIQYGNGMYFNAFQNYTVTSSDNPVDVQQRILNNPELRSRLLASDSDFSKLGKTQIMESLVRKGQESFLNHPVTKMTVEVLATLLTGGLSRSVATVAGKTTKALAKELPTQIHHFATNKHSIWTSKMQNIAKHYGLDMNGAWNKAALPHLGRHPNAYHNFVYQNMQRAATEAGGNQTKFLQLFNQYVKQPVLQNPELLRKSGW